MLNIHKHQTSNTDALILQYNSKKLKLCNFNDIFQKIITNYK